MPETKDLGFLSEAGIDFGVLVPTETGLGKGIMDATEALRGYFKEAGYHEYEQQEQGIILKLPASYFGALGDLKSTVSLYRPNAKNGDPRIWVSKLKSLATAGETLVLIVHEGTLNVFNSDQRDLKAELADPNSFLHHLSQNQLQVSNVADELLHKIESIYQQGFIPSMREGDTGVGYTLETLLGIRANSSRAPDYKGIEIKSTRSNKNRNPQLFAKCPDWKRSTYDAWSTLMTFGYPTIEADPPPISSYRLNCTVQASMPNPQGFILRVEASDHDLWAHNLQTSEDVFVWGINQLKVQFLKKHRETFWVKAESTDRRMGIEKFKYSRVVHTKNPTATTFERILTDGGIRVEFTMKVKSETSNRVRDHGYLFKIKPEKFHELFPVIRNVDFSL